MMNNLTRIAEQLRTVRDDLEFLSATVTPDKKIALHLVNRLRIATDNVAGCKILAEHDLPSPLLIVGRAIVESLFITYWATLQKSNGEIVLRLDRDEIVRVMKSQLHGSDRVAEIRNKTTRQKVTGRILKHPKMAKLENKLNIFEIAKKCRLKPIYDIAYRPLCLPTHGNSTAVMINPSMAVRGAIEAVTCTLKAIHLVVSNYIREERTTNPDDILKIMFPRQTGVNFP